MAAAELTPRGPLIRRGPGLARALLASYLALCSATIALGGLWAICAPASARGILELHLAGRLAPSPGAARMLALTAHNLPIAAWPLLLGRLRVRRALARRITDALVLGCAVANIAPVAIAIGGYGTALAPYLPGLPLEWAALAVGYGSWVHIRHDTREPASTGKLALAICVLLAGAAALETFAVPHH